MCSTVKLIKATIIALLLTGCANVTIYKTFIIYDNKVGISDSFEVGCDE